MIQYDRGVLYTATGAGWIERAAISAESVKRYADLPCAVFTDDPDTATATGQFDIVEPLRDIHPHLIDTHREKLEVLRRSPFHKTLYLDADTLATCDVREVFELLPRYDYAITHAHRSEAWLRIYGTQQIPPVFVPVQSGVLLYRRCAAVAEFHRRVIRHFVINRLGRDQEAFREVLWQATPSMNMYVLPREWNFNAIDDAREWFANNCDVARPRIFHYKSREPWRAQIEKMQCMVDNAKGTRG